MLTATIDTGTFLKKISIEMVYMMKSGPAAKELKEKQRRERIIVSAIEQFSTKGYDRVSIESIAANSGFSKSLIYYYWKNKAALYAELIDICMNPYVELMKKTFASTEPFAQKLADHMWKFNEIFKSNTELNRLIVGGLMITSPDPEENFHAMIIEKLKKMQKQIEDLFLQGIEAGYFKKDIDVRANALLMISCSVGFIQVSFVDPEIPVERGLTQYALQYFFPSLLANSGED